MTTANNLEALASKAFGSAPEGLPDIQELSRLANQFFGQIQCDGSRLQGLTQVASQPDISASYLVSLYCSLAVLTDDALGVLENVAVDSYYDYSK